MCGIGGWYCWDDKARPTPKLLQALLLTNSVRGTDASGVAYLGQHEGKEAILYRKDAISPTEMVAAISEEEWNMIGKSPIGLIHARSKTKGTEKDNRNNHPVVGYGWVAVHNGMIHNDDQLFDFYKDERLAEVDSIVLPMLLSKGKTIEESIKYLSITGGPATFAAWNTGDREHLLIGRFGYNDLYMFLDIKNMILYFSSAAIFAKAMQAFRIGNIHFLTSSKLNDDRVLLLDKDFRKCRSFKVTRIPYRPIKVWRGGGMQQTTGLVKESLDKDKGELRVVITKEAYLGPDRYEAVWGQDDVALRGSKPWPDTHNFTTEYLFYDQIERETEKKEGKKHIIFTPYGRWILLKSEGKVHRRFKPRGTVAKWWRRKLNFKSVTLPQDIEATGLDFVLPREPYTVKKEIHSGSMMQFLGFLCPWCGIPTATPEWQRHAHRCPFCLVRSQTYSGA